MNGQMNDLFAMTPASRATDPVTSAEAEEFMNSSGARAGQQMMVLRAVQKSPGHTGKELAKVHGLDRYVVGRRLSELETAGKIVRGGIRQCSIGKTRATVWYPVD